MLKVKNITKCYGEKTALKNVSITMENGVYGLLGPNGAGKSTLMNIITDSMRADSGEVLWNGRLISDMGAKFRALLGYMPQQQGVYEEFTGRRFLAYMGALKKIPKRTLPSEIERTAAMVNLSDQLDRPMGAYSGGMKQRILMSQAILGDPKLLIFDEPTAGLDPMERVRTRNFMKELGRERVVIIATHVVSDIETIASRIIMLKQGEIQADERPGVLITNTCGASCLEDVYLQIFGEQAGEVPPCS